MVQSGHQHRLHDTQIRRVHETIPIELQHIVMQLCWRDLALARCVRPSTNGIQSSAWRCVLPNKRSTRANSTRNIYAFTLNICIFFNIYWNDCSSRANKGLRFNLQQIWHVLVWLLCRFPAPKMVKHCLTPIAVNHNRWNSLVTMGRPASSESCIVTMLRVDSTPTNTTASQRQSRMKNGAESY